MGLPDLWGDQSLRHAGGLIVRAADANDKWRWNIAPATLIHIRDKPPSCRATRPQENKETEI